MKNRRLTDSSSEKYRDGRSEWKTARPTDAVDGPRRPTTRGYTQSMASPVTLCFPAARPRVTLAIAASVVGLMLVGAAIRGIHTDNSVDIFL